MISIFPPPIEMPASSREPSSSEMRMRAVLGCVYRSVFDIIGPVMIGPSSSHTAGAARIGRVARSVFGREPKQIVVSLYGSFAETYKGHGTDVAIIGGLLDFDTFDERIKDSIRLAEEKAVAVVMDD